MFIYIVHFLCTPFEIQDYFALSKRLQFFWVKTIHFENDVCFFKGGAQKKILCFSD